MFTGYAPRRGDKTDGERKTGAGANLENDLKYISKQVHELGRISREEWASDIAFCGYIMSTERSFQL